MIKVECGFVKVVDCMPRENCDKRIVNSARISYGYKKSEKFTAKDKNLLYFLMENQHTSPFEMVEFLFHIKAPLFVARQWFRHRTFSYNEISARYTTVEPEFFIPREIRCQSEENFQQSGGILKEGSKEFIQICKEDSEAAYKKYLESLKNGVPREQARILLPQNMMTEFYCKGNLHNWLRFIRLRNSKEAQSEIKDYAMVIEELIREKCPFSLDAYRDFNNGVTFSQSELEAISNPSSMEKWSNRKKNKLDTKLIKFNKIKN